MPTPLLTRCLLPYYPDTARGTGNCGGRFQGRSLARVPREDQITAPDKGVLAVCARTRSPPGPHPAAASARVLCQPASIPPELGSYGKHITDLPGIEQPPLREWRAWTAPGHTTLTSPTYTPVAQAKTKEDMEAYGYVRRPDSAHIERSIMVRQSAIFEQRFYRGPGPKTAAMRLPWPQVLTTGMPLLEMAASMPAAGGDGAGKKPAKKK